ncbi:hypothetical protein PRIPAC_84125 [Pristionchus pacificus]|uniref:Uncharacterized protein n=1 Tax=Pristionchus pacificus TaxID=54126 RepID=A0A454Y686_PRIPA|nr:hypothetical protein PRIPAC_84125 [Pristionchus pacificus]|eukprot:PDM69457.1 hypothetical protein PRIPAC_44553 [Pristionchus pacificus]
MSLYLVVLLLCNFVVIQIGATYVPQCDEALSKASCVACTEDVVTKERHTAVMTEINLTNDFTVMQ